jgi:murein DD-endopeptidase MepM/ murein hydrolase activator NlpD
MICRLYSSLKGESYNRIILIILLVLFVTGSCARRQSKEQMTGSTAASDTALSGKSPSSMLFGIPVDSFNIIKGKIRVNTFLSQILGNYGVTPTRTDRIIRNSKGIFDVRELRTGNNFTILTDRDRIARLRYFIYENDPTLYYIFSFNDSLKVTPFRVNTTTEIRFASLAIETSLWDALIGKGLNPELAVDLSDIYAWTVDFFGLQKGDMFRFIYEENFIGEKAIGTGRIICALFTSSGKQIYAIPMIQDDKETYYDANGNSLRKEFLKAPQHFSRISSGFSSARMHPVLRIVRPHYGVDYAAPAGTPVYSIGDGTIISATIEEEPGRIVRIRHNSVYTTAYMHLSGFAAGIAAGVRVRQGDVIGYVGSTGMATGPHLDFRFYKNGYPVDPLKVEAPPVEPVLDENRAKFEKIKSVIVSLLDSFN